MSRIYVLHENSTWVEPLREAFGELGLPYAEWHLDQGTLAFDSTPPQGVFYNRMSASAHTRGHRFAPELAHGVLNWLELYDRRVVNSSRALYLEVSKLAQYAALTRAGIRTPRTVAAVGRDNVLAAARDFGPGPYILKPNRGGKGLGVHLAPGVEAVAELLERADAAGEAPIDGIWLIQDYIRPPAPYITRCEFVGGRFLYAVRVDTSDGFELCPADACAIDPDTGEAPKKFTVLRDFAHPVLDLYGAFLKENRIGIAGIELIADETGEVFTYDVNVNTNYNAEAEADAAVPLTGMRAVARFLGEELARSQGLTPAVAAE